MAVVKSSMTFDLKQLERELGRQRLPQFIAACEANFQSQVADVAEKALKSRDISMILISGPTSSGKTTFSTRFTERLNRAGRRTFLISLDDYYLEGAVRYDEDGRPDFESVDTLDLNLLYENLTALQRGEEVHLPRFNFERRAREFPEENRIRLEKGDLLIAEGLHGLSHEIIGRIDRKTALGIFIMPYANFMNDERTLQSRDIRMLRRISRDVFHRGTSPMATLDFWPMIERAEKAFIPGYLAAADVFINSAMAYEFMVVAPSARYQLKRSIQQLWDGELPPSNNVHPGKAYADLNRAIKEAHRLLRATEHLPQVSLDLVPEDSILQEFI